MDISNIDWKFKNLNVPTTLYRQNYSRGLLIVFPGGGYPSFGPILYYPTNLYLDKNFDVLSLEYNFKKFNYEGDRDLFLRELGLFIFEKINTEYKYSEIHLLAKSIGTNIIAESYELIDEAVKANIKKIILLTPVWTQENVLKKLVQLGNKSFHVIGTADKLYDKNVETILKEKHIEFLTISNADHGLDTKDDIEQSILTLVNLVKSIKNFVNI